jgi:replicative DNA helicase
MNTNNNIDFAGRIPPNDPNAEKIVLSAMVQFSEHLESCLPLLSEECFYVHAHKDIFKAIYAIHKNNHTLDIASLIGQLNDTKRLEPVGGIQFVTDLVCFSPTVPNPEKVAKRLVYKKKQREMLSCLSQLLAEAYVNQENVPKWTDSVQQRIYGVSTENVDKKWSFDLNELSILLAQRLAGNIPPAPAPISYGLTDLDNSTNGGARPGELVIIAGRPGMGKSALALGIAQHITKNGHGVAYFSLEMQAEALLYRFVSSYAKVPSSVIKSAVEGKPILRPGHADQIIESLIKFKEFPMQINEKPGISCSYIRSELRKFSVKYHPGKTLKAVFVDYVQLMNSDEKIESREQQVAGITRQLKEIAKEFNCVVYACAQLNRKSEERSDRRPQLSDLRESGAIEQDADVVLFPFRQAYAMRAQNGMQQTNKEEAEIIIAKQREGAPGTVKVCYVPRSSSFEDAEFEVKERGFEDE